MKSFGVAILPLMAGISLLGSGLLSPDGPARDGPPSPSTWTYELVEGWITAPVEVGSVSGVDVDRDGNVFAFRRGGNNIWVLDDRGHLLREWGQDIAVWSHAIRVDFSGHVWTVDGQGHEILKWSPDASEIVLRLGTAGVAGEGPNTFNRPTDVAVASNGDLFVSDGYVNSRVVKFDSEGRFLRQWGEPGDAPGQFNTVHSIVLDEGRGRVLVADRDNHRIQLFDLEGSLLDVWDHLGSPYSLHISASGRLYVADGINSRIWIADAGSGALITTIEDTDGIHWVGVNPDEDLVYAASNRSSYLRLYRKTDSQ
jgi:DNA-binding beta-propeller fold protein YncE